MSEFGNQILGRSILDEVKQSYQGFRAAFSNLSRKIAIIRFEPRVDAPQLDRARYEAAAISSRQKIKTFNFLGCQTDEYVKSSLFSKQEFEDLLARLNQDESTTGIIVQLPVSLELRPTLAFAIAPEKDLDALGRSPSLFPICATAEGIVRIVEPFVSPDSIVAVVGHLGFVGRGIVERLSQKAINYIGLERDDDLTPIRDTDLVISATGQPEILDERHLTPYHRLVVDSGFTPIKGEIFGDVKKSAYAIVQNITPVPGGTGPIEMAILMERIVRKEINPNLQPWTYSAPSYRTRAEVEAILQQQRQSQPDLEL